MYIDKGLFSVSTDAINESNLGKWNFLQYFFNEDYLSRKQQNLDIL